ncbi:LD-carboxypeptidase [Brevundimonas sp.]|uniref:S66 peptidase family protein n=1 Tax=Brevundimonas sp. TaxID=1871086 RepID=UPI00272FF03A|nr:LD-carboxypeptidase [Brevundimonas sp.]MDP1912215.1 LD-carboxypeptidase [Brevundimonas sp.]
MNPPLAQGAQGGTSSDELARTGFSTLQPGDRVAVLAPAGPAAPEALAAVAPLYARHGLRVRLYPSCHADSGYLAGPDALRLADLHAALADDEVAALHCLRGGYGAMRLLDGIDTALVRRSRKLLIGYSDITALHALWCREGLASLHAPMPASDLVLPGREGDEQALFTLLRQGLRAGERLAPELDPAPRAAGLHHPGRAEGRLIGGNLSLVAALLGTPWAWPAPGAILFLEDVGEELYRVDRLLTQLRLAGVLEAAAGFVLGSFTEEASPAALLREMLGTLGKPLLAGWPAGHGTPNRPLPLGVRVALDADAGTLQLREDFLQAK